MHFIFSADISLSIWVDDLKEIITGNGELGCVKMVDETRFSQFRPACEQNQFTPWKTMAR